MKKTRWALTTIGIVGATLNAFKIDLCFVLWAVGNVGWIVVNLHRRQRPEALLFTAYLATSLIGMYMWGN